MTRRALLLGLMTMAGTLSAVGCSKPERCLIENRPLKSALLFGPNESVSLMSTQIGREPWPVADDGYKLPDVSVSQEFYYDTTGNRFNEQNFPRRTTWGYRFSGTER